MLRQGPLSTFSHGIGEYFASVLFIAAPFIFGFESDAATALAIIVGVGLLAFTASSGFPTSLVNVVPVLVHVGVDFGLSVFLIAAPFIFGFSDETDPTIWFIVGGVIQLLVSIGTRYLGPAPAHRADLG